MEGLWIDLRFGVRLLRRAPGFAAVAILTLALGIGASISIFTALHRIVLRPLAYGTPEELVFLNETSPDGRLVFSVSIPNLEDWRERNRSFVSLAGFRASSFNLTGAETPVRVRGAMVSANFFETLKVPALFGRALVSRDGLPTDELSVVISYDLWQRQFGARNDLVGQSVVLNGRGFVVRGILPRQFEFLSPTIELWVPMERFRDVLPWTDRGSHPGLWVVGRLSEGATLSSAERDMLRVSREIRDETGHRDGISLTPLHDRSIRRARPALWTLMGAVVLLLLITCVNVANLLLARSGARAREFLTRSALGAARSRLVAQLGVESILLTLSGGALGLLVADWGVSLLRVLLPAGMPRLPELSLDGVSVGLAIAFSCASALAFGLFSWRREKNVAASEWVRVAGGGSRSGLRRGLVVAEVALTIILLVAAGLLMKSFVALSRVDPGFSPEERVTARIALAPGKYESARSSVSFFQELLRIARDVPGFEDVSVSTGLPLVDAGMESRVAIEGDEQDPERGALTSVQLVSDAYFRTMGTALLSGRGFGVSDTEHSSRVVVIDQRLSEQLFGPESPLGRRLYVSGTPESPEFAEIVGVVEHVRNYQLRSEEYGEVYLPLAQVPSFLPRLPEGNVVVKSKRPHEEVIAALRDSVAVLDPEQPIYGSAALATILERELEPSKVNGWLFSAFAIVALLLSALGLYGVMTSLVAQRTREIGVRVALGATPRDILRAVYVEGIAFTAMGIVLGAASVWLLAPIAHSLLFEVSVLEPDVILAAVVVVLGVASVAIGMPARSAMRLSPVRALRWD